MKKIVIEQVGNIGIMLLFTAATIDMINRSYFGANGIRLEYGWISNVFVVWLMGFLIIRHLLARKDRSFNPDAGEFSAADEREERIADRSVRMKYRFLVTGVMVSLLIISGLGIVNGMGTRLLAKISVLILGVLVSIGFVVYTICWMYFDRRMG
ncbi:MAG: hypothetical protein ABF743_13585 [Schleiferilactobacillus perolens]|uniref:hypothetical protein n=1 Tax=Schleiferilactobacillus perolens TaxID=100468 RepID=UPI0039ECE651